MNQNEVSTSFVTAAGARLEVRRLEARDTDAPTLVFLHEGLGCVDMWKDFPEAVAQRSGCPALIYSRQGYGRSDPCPLPRRRDYLEREAIDVLPVVISAEHVGSHILIGHSDGASIALVYAGSGCRRGLQGVVTMAPHVFGEDIAVRSIAEAKKAYETGELRSALQRYHSSNVDCAFYGWCDTWLDPGYVSWNIEKYLPAITVPQLVIQGRDDHYGTLAQVDSIAERSGGPVDTLAIEHCGHVPYREQRETTLQAIERFVRRRRASTGRSA